MTTDRHEDCDYCPTKQARAAKDRTKIELANAAYDIRTAIDEANARRKNAIRTFELPISRKDIPKKNRRSSVPHRAIR